LFDQLKNLALEGSTVPAFGGDDGRQIQLLHGVHSGQLSAHLQWSASAVHTAHQVRSAQERYSPSYYVTTLGIDLAKNVFQVHGIDQHGLVVRAAKVVPYSLKK
jgi:hypothetical protein